VTELTRLAIARDELAASRYIDDLTARGASLETICAELLAPAARELGDLWNDDQVSFTEVTTGVWRLQQILRSLAPAFGQDMAARGAIRQILLVPAIGEQHSFGIAMVAAHFRKAGWIVRTETVGSARDLADLVCGEWFDVIGFSVGSSDRLEELTACISTTRKASRNVHLGVMVGGPVFLAHPDFVALVGADATAANGAEATTNAEQLIGFMAHTG
jgi:methanogenic corrinoid protein MtbC1